MNAIIMAGGKGTRLSALAQDIPKPMVKLTGKPVLQHQIEKLKAYSINDITIVAGHISHVITDFFGNGEAFGVNIRYILEEFPLGTAGGLFYASDKIKDKTLLLFGDIFFDIDIKRFEDFHVSHNSELTLFAHPNSHPYDSDLLLVDDNNKIIKWDYKTNIRDYYYKNCSNAGVYIISSKIFDYLKEPVKTDFEKDIICKLIESNGAVYAYQSSEYLKDMGTLDRFKDVSSAIEKNIPQLKNLSKKQACVFLDRDGTINQFKGLLTRAEDFELIEGVAKTIKALNCSKYLVIIITNQPVIARGDCTEAELLEIHKKMETLLGKEGAFIDDLFYCPHHTDKGFPGEVKNLKIDCACRKPKIGLIEQAVKKHNIDLSKSYFIGDTTIDIMTGKNASIKTVLVKTGMAGSDKKYDVKPDFTIENLEKLLNILEI